MPYNALSDKKTSSHQGGISRRRFLNVAGLGAAALFLPKHAYSGGTSQKPNVIYLFSDTHRWGAMPFTQTPHVFTPFMELMLQQGVSMDRCYSTLPICTPYRAILMTGRWPWQQGLMANHMNLVNRVDLPVVDKYRGNLGWMFKTAEYNTGYFGKWHLGGTDVRPFGFDKSIVWAGTNNHITCKYYVDGGTAQTWDRGATDDSNCTPTVTQALNWLDTHYTDPDPFFVMISLNPPHGNMTDAPEGEKARYPDLDSLPWHPYDELHEWDQHQGYHAHVSDVDMEIGRVMAKMDELGITNDTIFIYTSDHGGMSGVRSIAYGQKRNPEDEATRLPFLITWPGKIPSNVRLNNLFSTIDHFPTLCSLANLPQQLSDIGTSEAIKAVAYLNDCPGLDHSKNLLGLPGGPDPESVFIMHPSNMNNGSAWQTVFRGVVTKDYTYAVAPDQEYCLYDNRGEYQYPNLVDDPETYPFRKSLWNLIRDWMELAEDPFIDNWFAKMNLNEVKSWNAEHSLTPVDDRELGKTAIFNIYNSRPVAPASTAALHWDKYR